MQKSQEIIKLVEETMEKISMAIDPKIRAYKDDIRPYIFELAVNAAIINEADYLRVVKSSSGTINNEIKYYNHQLRISLNQPTINHIISETYQYRNVLSEKEFKERIEMIIKRSKE